MPFDLKTKPTVPSSTIENPASSEIPRQAKVSLSLLQYCERRVPLNDLPIRKVHTVIPT